MRGPDGAQSTPRGGGPGRPAPVSPGAGCTDPRPGGTSCRAGLRPARPTPDPAHRPDAGRAGAACVPSRVSGWVWPVVAVVSLLVGLTGGFLGGAFGYDQWDDSSPHRGGTRVGPDARTPRPWRPTTGRSPPWPRPCCRARCRSSPPSRVRTKGRRGPASCSTGRGTSSPTTTSSRRRPRTRAPSRSSTATVSATTPPSWGAVLSTTWRSSRSTLPRAWSPQPSARRRCCAWVTPSSRSAPPWA